MMMMIVNIQLYLHDLILTFFLAQCRHVVVSWVHANKTESFIIQTIQSFQYSSFFDSRLLPLPTHVLCTCLYIKIMMMTMMVVMVLYTSYISLFVYWRRLSTTQLWWWWWWLWWWWWWRCSGASISPSYIHTSSHSNVYRGGIIYYVLRASTAALKEKGATKKHTPELYTKAKSELYLPICGGCGAAMAVAAAIV